MATRWGAGVRPVARQLQRLPLGRRPRGCPFIQPRRGWGALPELRATTSVRQNSPRDRARTFGGVDGRRAHRQDVRPRQPRPPASVTRVPPRASRAGSRAARVRDVGARAVESRMILGTAGHVDHGKTALVKALTGVDTDRLEEEKRRGITIDLGFAPLRLPNGVTLGVVDVPGHEAFVRTMLAGATGIDFALLVIAADEGPMPQTREHLAILELLQVPKLVVALSKSDLVDADWLALVTQEVCALLDTTPFKSAEIIPTSVVANSGLDRVRSALM